MLFALCCFWPVSRDASAQTTLIADAFEGPNGTALTSHVPNVNVVNGTWAVRATEMMTLQSGHLRSTQQSAPYQPIATIDSSTPDGTIGADWTPAGGLPNGPVGGIIFRVADDNNFWFAGYGLYGTQLALFRFVNGNGQLVSNVIPSGSLWITHRIEVRLAGSSIQVWYDGTMSLTATDTYPSSPRHGLLWGAGADWASTFDDFTVQVQIPQVARISVTPAGSLVGTGSAQYLTAQAYDASNNPITNPMLHWSLSDASAGILQTPSYFSTTAGIRVLTRNVSAIVTALSGVSGNGDITVSSGRTMVYDSFSGATGTALTSHTPDINAANGAWTVHATSMMTLSNGQLRSSQYEAPYQPIATFDASTANGSISADWTPAAGLPYGPIGGVIFRVADDYNFWFAGYGLYGVQLGLFRFINGNGNLVSSASVANPLGNTHHFDVRLSGGSIEVWYDGSRYFSTTDGYASSTHHGLMWGAGADWASTFDNFAVQLPPLPSATSVTISPAAATVYPGGLQTFTAEARDASNAVIPGTLFHWTISDPSNGQVVTTSYYATSAIVQSVTASTIVTATPVSGPSGSASITINSSRTIIFDAFTGPTGTPLVDHPPTIDVVGSPWSVHATEMMTLQGQQVRSTQQTAPYQPMALIDANASDGVVAVDWSPASGLPYGPVGGLVFRAVDTLNHWVAGYGWQGTQLALWRVTNGLSELMESVSVDNPIGRAHHIEVRTTAAQIQVWWDGTLALQTSDSRYSTATKDGVMWGAGADWASAFDNFVVQAPAYPTISYVVVSPASPTVNIGGFQVLTAQAFDGASQTIPSALFHWTISDPSAAILVTSGYFSNTASIRSVTRDVTVTATLDIGPSATASVIVDTSQTLVLDTFSAPDGTTLANHTPDIDVAGTNWNVRATQMMTIQALTLRSHQQDAPYQPIATIDTAATDGSVAIDWAPAAGLPYGPVGGVIFRATDANDYWFAGYGLYGTRLALFRFFNGNGFLVDMADVSNPIGGVHHIEVRLRGLSIEVWWDGTKKLQARAGAGASAITHGVLWGAGADWLSSIDNFSLVGTPRCLAPLSSSALTVEYGGTSNSFSVSAPGTCAWTAETDAAWITLQSPTTGTGNATINYTVSPNTTYSWRAGTIAVGGRSLTISQEPVPPPPCTFTLWPGSASWAGDGGSGAFDVTPSSGGCTWTASTGYSWIHTSTSGQGFGTVTYSVDPNPTSVPRSGTVAVGGFPGTVLFAVNQDPAGTTGGGAGGRGGRPGMTPGGACVFSVSARDLQFGAAGGTAAIQVTASAGCNTEVLASAEWVATDVSQGSGSWSFSVTAQPNGSSGFRGAVLTVGDTFVLIDQQGTAGPVPQTVTVVPALCNDCDPQPYPPPSPPVPPPLVSRTCGIDDCDGDGIRDDDEDALALRWFPDIHMIYQECGLLFNPPTPFVPVIFRARYMSYGGVIDTNHIAISYVILYNKDCGGPGYPLEHVIDVFVAHPGDAEPFVVFLEKAPDGTWDTPASFQSIAAVAHAGTGAEVQTVSSALNAHFKPDLWVGYSKHGNFVQLSKCTPDWLNFCRNGYYGYRFKQFNVGERSTRFITDLGQINSRWNGQHVWDCQKFLGGPAVVSAGLYLKPFQFGPPAPGPSSWDDADVVPYSQQVAPVIYCSR